MSFKYFVKKNLLQRNKKHPLILQSLRWQPPFFPPYLKKEIVIERRQGVGDVLMGTAVIAEIKKKNPNCHITYLVADWIKPILKNNPDIDECVGITADSDRITSKTVRLEYIDYAPPRLHLIDYMAACVGLKDVPAKLYCYVDPESKKEVQAMLSDLPKPWIVICREHSEFTPNKDWPEAHWKELVEKLGRNFSIVEAGVKKEKELKHINKKGIRHRSLFGKTNILQFVALIAESQLLIGPVSGPMHIAKAVGTSSIVIAGGFEDPTYSSYPENIDLFSSIACSPCWLHSPCPYSHECLTQIFVDDVVSKVNQLLQAHL